MSDRIGQQLGNYRLVRLLGRGGFAEVYLGEHRYLKSYAALKVLRASLKDEDVERFLSEAQTLVRLRHPNIVRVLEFAVERGTPVLVMDYAPGGTVRQRHPRGSCLSLATTVAYSKQVAAALQYAHNHNVIHRDVKPENILLGSAQQILLSDFGIALLSPSPELLSTPDMAGTLPYTAPEQLRGKPSFASDQYALGIVVYEWLCGKRPFEGTHWQIIHQHMSVAPPPLRDTFPELPAAVEEVVLRALAKDPQQRFVSVQAFAHALERASQVSSVEILDDSEITAPLKAISPPSVITPPDRTPQRVFLSAAPADDAFAARLRADLEVRGILFWNYDSESTLTTPDQEDAVRQAIRAAHIALVVVSPDMRSSRAIKEHLRIASIYGRQLVFVWAAGDDITEVLPEAWGKTALIDLIDARQTRYEAALDEIVAYLEEETAVTSPLIPFFAGPQGEPRNPYKGLRAFAKEDAADFFGRDALIQELVETMKGALTSEEPGIYGARLLPLIGPSGSGKSSVMMAGLLPRLQRGALAGSEEWVYLEPLVPGIHPLESLALTLAPRLLNRSLRSIREDLEDVSARGLHLLATQVVKRPGVRAVLMIDQFEELFTQAVSEDERRHFIDLLATAVTEPRGPVIVLLTLRADFYDRPLSYPELGLLIQDYQRVVLPMEIEDLRAVIEQPAALPDVQLTFEGNLVGDLLFEAQGQAGALPLLEFTLDQLFQQRDGHWLTQQAYQKIGGVKGALAKHAESTYASLPSEEHRRLAQALFLRLIDPGTTERDTTRRRAALAELSLPDPKQTAIIQAVADAFVAARLLTTNEVAGTTTIEVSHEALIREWRRLAEWLREAREDISLQQGISADTAEWIRRERPVDRLYRGTQLAEAQAWAKRNVPSADEVAFLQASTAERQQQEQLELSRQARELNLQRRVVGRQRLLVAVLSIFSIVAILLASVAGLNFLQAQAQQKRAELEAQLAIAQEQIARSRALATDASISLLQHKLDLALLLSVEAYKTRNTYEARDSLLSALEQSPQITTMLRSEFHEQLLTLTFSSDGRMFVASDNHRVYIWNIKTKEGPIRVFDKQEYVGGVALSPDDRTLAISSATGVWLWDIQTGTPPDKLDGGIEGLPTGYEPRTAITFSSDGQFVASARCSQYSSNQNPPVCVQTKVSAWNAVSKRPSGLPHIIPANGDSATFSADGQILASSSGANIQLWDVPTGQPRGPSLTGHTVAITSLAFSPNGKILASASGTGSGANIQLWDVPTGQPRGPPLTGHTDAITSLAFSPDGHKLASSSIDTTVRVWEVVSGQLDTTLTGDAQQKWSVAFSTDNKTLISGSGDGTVLLWNIDARNTISRQLADIGVLRNPIFSPDGAIVLVGSIDGRIFLYDVKTGKLLQQLNTLSYPIINRKVPDDLRAIQSLALNGDGRTLASGRLDGTILVWDMKTRQILTHLMHPNLLYEVMLSSSGQTLAASGGGDTITLWNVAKRAFIRSLPYYHTDDQLNRLPIALSPDGKLLAVGGCGQVKNAASCNKGQVLLWDVATGKAISQPLIGHQFPVSALAFSQDGHTLASSSHDGIILWNVTAGKQNGHKLFLPTENTDYYSNILFSSNGKMLASYGASGNPFSFVLWDVVQQEPLAHTIREDNFNQGGLALNPNGQQLISVEVLPSSPDMGILTLWDITIEKWQEQACTIANRDLTQEEWNQFVKVDRHSKVCPSLAT